MLLLAGKLRSVKLLGTLSLRALDLDLDQQALGQVLYSDMLEPRLGLLLVNLFLRQDKLLL